LLGRQVSRKRKTPGLSEGLNFRHDLLPQDIRLEYLKMIYSETDFDDFFWYVIPFPAIVSIQQFV
jgi:hypothetical protein